MAFRGAKREFFYWKLHKCFLKKFVQKQTDVFGCTKHRFFSMNFHMSGFKKTRWTALFGLHQFSKKSRQVYKCTCPYS